MVIVVATVDSSAEVDMMVEYREFLEAVKVELQDYEIIALAAAVEEEALAKSYPARAIDAAATYEAFVDAEAEARVDAVAS